jgi:hypothetical protein
LRSLQCLEVTQCCIVQVFYVELAVIEDRRDASVGKRWPCRRRVATLYHLMSIVQAVTAPVLRLWPGLRALCFLRAIARSFLMSQRCGPKYSSSQLSGHAVGELADEGCAVSNPAAEPSVGRVIRGYDIRFRETRAETGGSIRWSTPTGSHGSTLG